MNTRLNRRRFIYRAGGLTAGALTMPMITGNVLGANEKVNIAAVGAGGKGAVDIGYCSGENVVSLCDVDQNNAKASYKKFPKAKRFKDFRIMLEKDHKNIDAVTVSTPDHLHAVVSIMAMKMGKHVYCQKPLTHSVHEARLMTKIAREQKVVTQMGNQGHSEVGSRRMVELVHAGVIGPVREAHVWTDRPIWPQGQTALDAKKKSAGTKAPKTLDWDLWLGPTADRPYNPAYLPFKWRGWWDWGTGSLGDMGCHNMDMAFWALNLRDPITIEAKTSAKSPNKNFESYPDWSIIEYQFAKRGDMPACKLTWYDKMKKPPASLVKVDKLPRNGCILVGEKDTLYVPHYWGPGNFISGAKLDDFKDVPQTLPRRPGNNDHQHHLEWIEAIKGNGKTYSDFDYAGPMSEAVLLGNVAMRAGKKVHWDAKKMQATNLANSDALITRQYRKGWEL